MKYKVIPMTEKEKTKKLLRGDCWHVIEERGPVGGARCVSCGDWMRDGNTFGWYCPDSPDHQCHYFSQEDGKGNRFVESINGEKIILLKYKVDVKGYVNGGSRESYDWCIFCGEPEERK
jgi:hypothetical protein